MTQARQALTVAPLRHNEALHAAAEQASQPHKLLPTVARQAAPLLAVVLAVVLLLLYDDCIIGALRRVELGQSGQPSRYKFLKLR